jgi:hypothetical protein
MAARGRTACPWTLLREPRPGPSPSRPLRAGPMAPSGLRQVRAACLPGPYQHTAARVDGAAVHLLPAPQLCIMTGRSGDRAGSVERLQLGHRSDQTHAPCGTADGRHLGQPSVRSPCDTPRRRDGHDLAEAAAVLRGLMEAACRDA